MKRGFDVVVAIVALALLSPLLLIIACLVRWKLGAPILFRHERPGKGGCPFVLYKFRTMLDRTGSDGNFLPDALRLTKFGAFLRSTSLDELPELINVFKGEMSLVGPRPLLMEYLSLYSPYQTRRHEVLPGITGWAQINGRNSIGWDERLNLDVWYVDNQSFWLDCCILWQTFFKVLRREGIRQEGRATMEKFTGSDKTHV